MYQKPNIILMYDVFPLLLARNDKMVKKKILSEV